VYLKELRVLEMTCFIILLQILSLNVVIAEFKCQFRFLSPGSYFGADLEQIRIGTNVQKNSPFVGESA
jgi:hypothetical protein